MRLLAVSPWQIAGRSFKRYDVLASGCGGCGGATGLYCGAGLAGLLSGLICDFLGFFFSLPRLSRHVVARTQTHPLETDPAAEYKTLRPVSE